MLVRFSLDPTALPCESAEFRDGKLHRDVLRAWEDQGLLVHDGGAFWSRIEMFSDDLRKMWQLARERLPAEREPALAALPAWDAEPDLRSLAAIVEVVGVPEQRANRFGLTPECPSTRLSATELEVCVLSELAYTDRFERNTRLRNEPLKQKWSMERVWNERFALLASRSNRIEIFDRYCVEGLVKLQPGGLNTFLKLLDRHPRERVVNIVASLPAGDVSLDQVDAAFERLVGTLQGDGVKEVRLFLTSSGNKWKKRGHDRFIVFQDAIVEMGSGLGAFGVTSVYKDTTFRVLSIRSSRGGAGTGAETASSHLDKIHTFQRDVTPRIYHPARHRPPEDPL
jgi:hypothetical protein